jgi:translation initiation factor IF-1
MSKKRNDRPSPGETKERDDKIEMEGTVEECLPGTFFRVRTKLNTDVLCTLAGKLRVNRIRLLVNDRVSIAVSPYDVSRGRVIYRH